MLIKAVFSAVWQMGAHSCSWDERVIFRGWRGACLLDPLSFGGRRGTIVKLLVFWVFLQDESCFPLSGARIC